MSFGGDGKQKNVVASCQKAWIWSGVGQIEKGLSWKSGKNSKNKWKNKKKKENWTSTLERGAWILEGTSDEMEKDCKAIWINWMSSSFERSR